jgi:hypothetical protein
MKAKYVVVPVWNRKVAHAISGKRQTLCGLEWKGTQWKDWPAKVKKCPQCQANLQGKLEEYFEKHSCPVKAVSDLKETSDLKKQGVKVGDEWQSYKGDKFKVREVRESGAVRIEWNDSGALEWLGDGSSCFFRKLLHREEAVKVEEKPVKEVSDLKVHGIRNGDLWETDKGDRFRVVYLHYDDEKLKRVEFQWLKFPNTTNTDNKEMTGIDYPFFHKLIERDGKVVKENEVKPDVLVVKVGDIWRSDNEVTVEVLAVDDGNFFCKYQTYGGALDRIVVTPREVKERRIFHQLVKRDGKDVMVKRVKPTYGMDLASYGIHQGDKWLDVDGQGFTVVAIESDGKGRILAVNIEDRPIGGLQNRIRLVQVSPDRFAYLVERDGKSMEGL